MKGVDLSHYQKGLELGRLREDGYAFAILKLTEGAGHVDGAAFDFYREAFERGFPVGGYCYSHALTPEAARAEAAFLLETLNGFPMPCGLFLDIEEPEQLALPSERLREIALAWCQAVREAGYVPGLYGSEYNLWAKLRAEALPEDALVWVAHYGREPDLPCDLWQSGDDGRAPGYDGPVDTDIARSARFMALVEGKAQEPDQSVMVLQALMRCAGLWGVPDGRKSPDFFVAARKYIDGLEAD